MKALERRLESWISGDLLGLLKKAETIQKSLRFKKISRNIAEISKRFSQEMKKGKVNSAMKILKNNMKNRILALTGQTLNQLKLKHPEVKEASQEILLTDTPETIHLIKFESIDVERYKKLQLRLKVVQDHQAWTRMVGNEF